ncbi:peptidase inhibitor family I36 protein [Streptomyces griseocarneus]|uniref:peptidase inhibitor family I36 protein n=1 Tax=Streptomyces griseocarneus TaxID=51201 RepID=UPI00167C8555|nr:peptidase inhibitor family I36 protein [Streptomyces griseocarneus]MBZ6475086.1 peptidase inhibitor family I36 protein [Streptomyces griseocarneus]GHG62325.1 hypothetical protein GCM10018779_30940 [Streptomyces griseocarneus]
MIKKTVSAALAAGALLVGGLVAATPAQASPHDCPPGNYCVWNKPGHEGNWEPFSWHSNLVPPLVFQKDQSSFNRMSKAMKLYSQPNRISSSYYACARAGVIWYQHRPAGKLASLGKMTTAGC